MEVGSWGTDIVFCVSDSRIFTFRDFKRSSGSEWAMHTRIGSRDQPEYIKPALQKVSFTMDLDAQYGVRPRDTLDMLIRHTEEGTVNTLVVGGKKVGRYRWRITSLSEAWEIVYTRGELARAKVDVTMEEYV